MSTVTTSQSWFSRLGGAIKGIIFGLLMFIGAFVLLFWNEGRTVERRKALDEGAGAVVEATVDTVDSSQEGELIHLIGKLETKDVLAFNDDPFGIDFNGIKLRRKVEIYQWEENEETTTHDKVGGSQETTTTYTYNKVWSEDPISSAGFHDSGYDNTGTMPFKSDTIQAQDVTMGAFKLSQSLIGMTSDFKELPIKEDIELDFNEELVGNQIYIGYDYKTPEIGDVRVSYSAITPGVVSVVSQQKGNTFVPYMTKQDQALEFLKHGEFSADQIFTEAQKQNTMIAWILRLIGFLLMVAGITTVLKPLEIIGDVIPFIGSIVGFGISIVAFLIALPLSLTTIAIAWIYYRPLLGIGLLIISAGIAFFTYKKVKENSKKGSKEANIKKEVKSEKKDTEKNK